MHTVVFIRFAVCIHDILILCLDVIKDAAFYFGVGLSNLILLLHPDVVICGGTLVPKPLFYEVVSETAKKRLMHLSDNHVPIYKSNAAYREQDVWC
ncbi:ROK family protein [Bacillus cereus]|uniref:ROK family protein n=1 Tax=Bacillus cereus TaxID=1396 RepID=UPI00144444DA|nr:ROK family protein [Bacillus cereus]